MFGREKKYAAEKPAQNESPTRPYYDEEVEHGGNVFSQGGKNYRTMGRKNTTFVLITNQVGLGILSLPGIVQTLGIVPGVIAIVGLGLLSTYTAYELLQFYRKHPSVINVVDMARIVGGRTLEIIVAIGLMIKLCLTCASASVTLSIAFNTLSGHAMCTAGWIGISAILCWLTCLPRTFKFVGRAGIPATISILAAVLIVIISLGVGEPQNAPSEAFSREINVIGYPTFREGLSACLNVCYAYAGNIGFVSYMAEMKDPSADFVPALIALQAFSIPLYLIAAVAIYCLAGQFTTSPSLGSAPELPAKIAYGIVLPALISTGMVFGHTGIKYLYVVVMKQLKMTHRMTDNSFASWGIWVGLATVFWVVAFLIANVVPIFDSILNISSATFIAWFTFGISAVFWFYLNQGRWFAGWKKTALSILNALIIVQALFMNGAGLWTAITNLMDIFKNNDEGQIKGVFTCADNSIF
jgi:hypothetical protein